MSACCKACFRALVFMASIMLCVCPWGEPVENFMTTTDLSADGACTPVIDRVVYSSQFSVSYDSSTVPTSGELFNVQLSENYIYQLICDPALLPDQSTTYTVTLIATSNGVDYTRTVTIHHALSSPNNAPQFAEGSDLPISIPKDSFEKGITSLRIFTVEDEDDDIVTLSISGGTPFSVNGMEIQIDASLVNTNSPFSLTVTATDNGSPPESSEVVLTITLFSAPEFTEPVDEEEIPICETYSKGELVTALTATDVDGGSITFSVVSVDPSVDYFVVDGGELLVHSGVANDVFDTDKPDAVPRYNVTLRASDGTYTSDIRVYIVVEDFNDNSPTFTETGPFTAQLLETSLPDTEVYTVIVTDNDRDDENRNFTFQLTGSPKFDINDEGIIYVTDSSEGLDYGLVPEYVLTITVNDTDDPDTTFTVSENLTVVIETAPEFIDVLPINVSESVSVGTVISTITVQDDDSLPNPLLIITISEDSDPADAFEVVDENKLVIKTELDAEVKQSYTLKFSCTDGKSTTVSTDVTINVGDMNDNAPVIIQISDIHIDEDTDPGVLANVNTLDDDVTTPNNEVTWFIESGNEDGYFGASSGSITLVSQPSSMTQNEFVLTIKATDGGTPPLSVTLNVSVIVSANSVDECESTPCQNDATCSSYVNAVACACTPGWSGEVCDSECTDNTFGQDCGQSCDCNVSRVADNRQDQTCEPVTGDCRCNDFWEGVACETDINECEDPAVCDIAEHRVCDNFDGGYACICENGYREIDNTCQEDECLLSPCENSGTCTDTLSGFTCACTSGWKLNTNCTQECDSNKFGQDCGQSCNCDVSRVAGSAQDQTCDPVIGDCKCNAQWTGADCETDVDECQVPAVCDIAEHRVCDNFDGGYACICENGYREIDNTCQEDECLLSPCENSGTCTDTLSGFTCACTSGWKLNTNCTQECDSNTFGQDCGQNCNCNVSRVAAISQDQTCHPVNGNCRCNAKWKGAACATDVDECQVADTCDAALNKVCKNEYGNYRCLCKQHFIDINGTCDKFEEMDNIPPGQLVVTLYLSIDNCPNLDEPWTYTQLKTELEEEVRKELKEITKEKKELITVGNIRCGSLKFDVVFPTSNSFEDTEKFVSAIEELKTNGSLVYDNQTVPLTVTDIGFTKGGNDSTFKPVNDFCDQSVCYRCEAVNTVMQCRVIPADNQPLIWGLGGFMIGLVLLGSIILLTGICYNRRKLNEKRNKRSKPSRKDRRSIPKMEKSDSDRVFRSTPYQDRYSSSNVPPLVHSVSFNQRYRTSPYTY